MNPISTTRLSLTALEDRAVMTANPFVNGVLAMPFASAPTALYTPPVAQPAPAASAVKPAVPVSPLSVKPAQLGFTVSMFTASGGKGGSVSMPAATPVVTATKLPAAAVKPTTPTAPVAPATTPVKPTGGITVPVNPNVNPTKNPFFSTPAVQTPLQGNQVQIVQGTKNPTAATIGQVYQMGFVTTPANNSATSGKAPYTAGSAITTQPIKPPGYTPNPSAHAVATNNTPQAAATYAAATLTVTGPATASPSAYAVATNNTPQAASTFAAATGRDQTAVNISNAAFGYTTFFS